MNPTSKQINYGKQHGLTPKVDRGCVGCALVGQPGCNTAPCGGSSRQPSVIFVQPEQAGAATTNISAEVRDLLKDTQLVAGRKDDGGKAPWGLLMRGCSAALAGVVAVLQFGARKYAADSWQRVEGAEERYKDALYRHLHSIETRGFLAKDPETGLLEWFHVACNALFLATFAAQRAKAEAEKETH